MQYSNAKLRELLDDHAKWIRGEGGSKADLSEADLIGLDLMAQSGFNPQESVKLWENMSKAGGGAPEFLSTHPSSQTRIKDLNARMPRALDAYNKAQGQNKKPSCRM